MEILREKNENFDFTSMNLLILKDYATLFLLVATLIYHFSFTANVVVVLVTSRFREDNLYFSTIRKLFYIVLHSITLHILFLQILYSPKMYIKVKILLNIQYT
jgi:hypothetical protein